MMIEQNQIARVLRAVDHTNLSVTATFEEIRETCEEAVHYGCATACIPAYYVKPISDIMPEVRICTVIGFPNGYNSTAAKCFEAEEAVRNGAVEIDMVINNGMLGSGVPEDILGEINAVKEVCGDALLKVIIETCLLTGEQKIELCHIVSSSHADFIKTSTGFSKSGATVEDVALLRANTDPRVGVKAAGGIATIEDAIAMLNAGADRLGTSRIVRIIKKMEEES